MKYAILSTVPKCPKCTALLKKRFEKEVYYKCNDCKTEYIIIGEGMNTKELEVEERVWERSS